VRKKEQSDSRIQYQSSPEVSDVDERCGMRWEESVQTTIPYTLRCDDHFAPHLGHLPLIPPGNKVEVNDLAFFDS